MRACLLLTAAVLALATPAIAQERPAGLAGSGVNPSERRNSAERPIRFAASVPAGAVLLIPVAAPLDVAKAAPGLDAASTAAIQAAATAARFDAKPLSTLMLPGMAGRPAVLLVGLEPEGAEPKETALADAAGKGLQALRDQPHEIAILAGGLKPGSAPYLAFGAALAQYRHDRLKSGVTPPPANPITLVAPTADAEARAYAADLAHLVTATRVARDLVHEPANVIYPETFVERVRAELAGVPNVRITVLDEADMRRLGMGSFVGVGQGSRRPSRLLAVEYRGGEGAPIALVGKGLTFDSGGISIKPALAMWEMKGDMSGAAAVMGAAIAAAKRGARANVVAVAALAENMPGSNAQRPGDVVRTLNGQTIEVINTDAEGRLVLADANQWAIRQFNPVGLVNIATLTGSIVAALGDEYSGLFARSEDLATRLTAGGRRTGEELWRMPLHPSYREDMASEIADIKNANEGGRAGAGTAAHFISFLTPEPTPWAHIDMAAVDRAEQALPTVPKGPRGYGVRLLDQLIRSYER